MNANRLLQRYAPQLGRGRQGQKSVGQGFGEQVTAVFQDELDQVVLTAGTDGAVRAYHRQTGAELQSFRGHESAVLAVCKKQNLVVSGGQDGRVVFYDAETGLVLQTLMLNSAVSCLELSPRGGFLLAVCLGKVCVFRLAGWAIARISDTPQGSQRQKSPKESVTAQLIREWKVPEKTFLHQACWVGQRVLFGGQGRLLVCDVGSGNTSEIPVEGEVVLAVAAVQQGVAQGVENSQQKEIHQAALAVGTKDGRVYVFAQ